MRKSLIYHNSCSQAVFPFGLIKKFQHFSLFLGELIMKVRLFSLLAALCFLAFTSGCDTISNITDIKLPLTFSGDPKVTNDTPDKVRWDGIDLDTISGYKENKDKIDLNELRKLLNLQISIFENEIKLLKPEKVFVTKIEMLPEKIEVGTLTIDSEEVFHNYHTFALNAGVFTFNSNLGEVTDLRLFTNKLFRGLRIPSSYLPTQTDETANVHADGKTGIAMIQEFRFNAYCKRLQTQIVDSFNREFKLFMRFRGINIDNSVFDLKFNEPQNFTKYRQIEVDTARIQTFTQLEQFPYLSKRFLMKRYLDLSEEEMQENEQLWAEENNEPSKVAPDSSNLRNVGVSAGGISSDMENAALPDMEGDMGGMDTGGEMGGPDMGGASAGGEMGAEPTM
jgi:anti-sigma28 factor (negative regulator of flagellin synthesis)